jgi:hypothetical protein
VAGALHGIKVVDFGQFIAGPLLAELLAQNGAEVVHIDPPGGPRLLGKPDAFLNRRKRRMVLDLSASEDRDTARRLAESADVLIENFRPGAMDAFGLGADELCAARPDLIYCSLPGFAADDPRTAMPAWEGVVMSATAGYRRLDDHWDWSARAHADIQDPRCPLFTAVPIASNAAALMGALEVGGFHLEFPGFVGAGDAPPKPILGTYECSDGGHMDQVSYPIFVKRLLQAAGATVERPCRPPLSGSHNGSTWNAMDHRWGPTPEPTCSCRRRWYKAWRWPTSAATHRPRTRWQILCIRTSPDSIRCS